MNAVNYDAAVNMGTLTLEEVEEQAYMAYKDLRTDDMVKYYNLLNRYHIAVSQNMEFGATLADHFYRQFNISVFYPFITKCILKGDLVCEHMTALFLLLFIRLKGRCFNFSEEPMPYLIFISPDRLKLLEEILNRYEQDGRLQEYIKDKVNDDLEYKKIQTLYFKLRILICDIWTKAVSYHPQRTYITLYYDMVKSSYDNPVNVRKEYVQRLKKLDPEYPVDINTWEGYGLEYDKLEDFFRQFGIHIQSPDFPKEYMPNPAFLERFYKIMATSGYDRHMILPNDYMASLFLKADDEREIKSTGVRAALLSAVMFVFSRINIFCRNNKAVQREAEQIAYMKKLYSGRLPLL